jgi:site-specific DNA-methyltransferase (adenine-specific)
MKERTWHRMILGDSRHMNEVEDKSVHLVVTSPPYWQLKDYGVKDQIGFNDSYKDYVDNLNMVWKECNRVLHPGCRFCINIGDQFARAIFYGGNKVIPIRTEIIKYCESIGFDYMGAIIWQKITTCQTTGGATSKAALDLNRNSAGYEINKDYLEIIKSKIGIFDEPPLFREDFDYEIIFQEESLHSVPRYYPE